MNPRITLWTALVALAGSLTLFADDLAAREPPRALVSAANAATPAVPVMAEAAK